MNAKNLKFLELFEDFVLTDFLNDQKALLSGFVGFLDLDYQMAVDVWDYIVTTREEDIATEETLANLLGETLFNVFYERSPQKCIKAINDTPAIRRAVYQHSAYANTNNSFIIFSDLLVANKINQGDEIMKCLIKNNYLSFGATMTKTLERVFIELLKKNPLKIEMSKKLSTLLLSYVKRIKTDERAMLEQRLREIL